MSEPIDPDNPYYQIWESGFGLVRSNQGADQAGQILQAMVTNSRDINPTDAWIQVDTLNQNGDPIRVKLTPVITPMPPPE